MADFTAAMALASDVTGPARRFTLYRVACLVNELHGWEFWLPADRLAEQVGCDPGTVRQYLRELVADGWLEVVEAGGGRGRPTRYRWARFGTLSTAVTDGDRKPRLTRGVSRETAAQAEETAAQADSRLLLHERHERYEPPQADTNGVDAERADLRSRIPEKAREPALAAIREARDNLHRRP